MLISSAFYIGNFFKNTISDDPSDWSAFGSYFGGTVAPILTFLTLIILIKQAKVVQDSTNIQVEHLNKSRKIDNILKAIDNCSIELVKVRDEVVPIPQENINLILNGKKYITWTQDFENKYLKIEFSESDHQIYLWKGIMSYLQDYIKNSINVPLLLNKTENKNLEILFNNLKFKILKLIFYCEDLLRIDKESVILVFPILNEFKDTIEKLYSNGLLEQSTYKTFLTLKSIVTEPKKIDIILKEIFIKELNETELINKPIKNFNEIEITQCIVDNNIEFLTEYRKHKFIRNNGKWSVKKP